MRLPRLEYEEPNTLQRLLDIKKEAGDKCLILAGGTDVIPLLKRRNYAQRRLVNIKEIPELRELSHSEIKGLRIGAAVTLREIVYDPVVSTVFPLLAKAAASVGYNQLRNMGTLGGNICLDAKCAYFNQSAFWWKSRPDCFKRGGDACYAVKGGKECYALSSADTVSALIALDAGLIIRNKDQERHILVEEFYSGDGKRPHQLEEDEVVTAVVISPPSKGWRDGFLKKSPRGSVDFAIATLSLRLKGNGGPVEDARIALNSVSSKPVRAVKAEACLKGKDLDDETVADALRLVLKEASPLSLIGASAFVRRKTIQAMFVDLIGQLSHQPG